MSPQPDEQGGQPAPQGIFSHFTIGSASSSNHTEVAAPRSANTRLTETGSGQHDTLGPFLLDRIMSRMYNRTRQPPVGMQPQEHPVISEAYWNDFTTALAVHAYYVVFQPGAPFPIKICEMAVALSEAIYHLHPTPEEGTAGQQAFQEVVNSAFKVMVAMRRNEKGAVQQDDRSWAEGRKEGISLVDALSYDMDSLEILIGHYIEIAATPPYRLCSSGNQDYQRGPNPGYLQCQQQMNQHQINRHQMSQFSGHGHPHPIGQPLHLTQGASSMPASGAPFRQQQMSFGSTYDVLPIPLGKPHHITAVQNPVSTTGEYSQQPQGPSNPATSVSGNTTQHHLAAYGFSFSSLAPPRDAQSFYASVFRVLGTPNNQAQNVQQLARYEQDIEYQIRSAFAKAIAISQAGVASSNPRTVIVVPTLLAMSSANFDRLIATIKAHAQYRVFCPSGMYRDNPHNMMAISGPIFVIIHDINHQLAEHFMAAFVQVHYCATQYSTKMIHHGSDDTVRKGRDVEKESFDKAVMELNRTFTSARLLEGVYDVNQETQLGLFGVSELEENECHSNYYLSLKRQPRL